MSDPPANPKIYHITHVENLASILAAGCIDSDARRIGQDLANTIIGMNKIKERRLALGVDCHAGTKVGEYVPFYFCPRSIMLFLIYCGNHPELNYTGGQRPIVHVEADLAKVIEWADASNHPWAFSTSNAGAYYTRFFKKKEQLNKINWEAVEAQDFRDPTVKEAKQAEFLVFDSLP